MIFDLDGTLVDTETLKEYLFDFLAICGFKGEQALTIYKSARYGDGKSEFTLDNFKEKLANKCKEEKKEFSEKNWQKMVKKLRNKKESLLIDGVKEVLQTLKDKKVPFYILTLGVTEWQKEKIRLAGLDNIILNDGETLDNCQHVKYTINEDAKEGKIKEIRQILSIVGSEKGESAVFFNDKPTETKEIMQDFPQMKVFIRREIRDKRFSDKDYEELAQMPMVVQISEQFDFLKKIKELI